MIKILTFLLLLIPTVIFSQITIIQESQNNSISDTIKKEKLSEKEIFFMQKVKLLDEFIARFNYSQKLDGTKITKNNPSEISQEKMLWSLVDYNYFKSDSLLVNNFVKDMISSKTKINFSKKNWIAIVNTQFSYKRHPTDIQIIMEIYTNEKNEMKWIIKDVSAPFINIKSSESVKENIFINPMSHETNFIDFRNVFSDTEIIEKYSSPDFKGDNLSVFYYLLKNKELKYMQVKDIHYYFQLKNYSFSVKNFNRAEYNTGWLISHIQKNNN